MLTLILGLVLFLGVHSVSIVAPAWRNSMTTRLGGIGWQALYAVIAIIGFVLVVRGYSAAKLAPVGLLMLPVFVLLFGSFLAWAVLDRISLNRRTPRTIPGAPPSKFNDLIAVAGGLSVYALFVTRWHASLFRVAPFG